MKNSDCSGEASRVCVLFLKESKRQAHLRPTLWKLSSGRVIVARTNVAAVLFINSLESGE